MVKTTSKSQRNVDWHEFVTVWQTSTTIIEVCERLGVQQACAYYRAATVRMKGINLKKLLRKSRSSPIDWNALKELAKSLE